MLSVLNQWNRWGLAKLDGGYPRDMTDKVSLFLNTREVVTLIGLRRSGKTTILYQLMDSLESQGVPREAMLHVNFEEPAIAPQLGLELLDELYRTYREEIYPTGKAYLFFDEIQNVPQWERWVRARNESENIKIFITGSSANLMSRELATVLTGRHVSFYVSPLSFSEFLQFKGIHPPKVMLIHAPAAIQHALKEYLQWGGLPAVVLSKHIEQKSMLLKQYFDDILFKDVALRHQIRDVTVLRNIAVHLITQTASLFSISRIAKIFEISLEMASNYCGFLHEAFLVDFLPYFSLKAAERNRNPQKIHVNDLGLRQITHLSGSPDYGKLIESLVYQQLQRKYRGDIFYWKKNQEVDFVLREGNSIHSVIQVTYDNLDDASVFEREMNALNEANDYFPKAKKILIAAKMPKVKDKCIMPLWNFLLEVT